MESSQLIKQITFTTGFGSDEEIQRVEVDITGRIRWRNDVDLKVNCFWLEHYGYDEGDPTKQYWKDSQSVWFDDVVVATTYVGLLGGSLIRLRHDFPEGWKLIFFLLLEIGMQLEPWADQVADGSGNPRIQAGQDGRIVASRGDGWRLPFPPFAELAQTGSIAGLDERARTLMETRAVPQPIGTYRQPLRLSGTGGSYERVVIACDDIRQLVAAGVPQILPLTQPAWRYEELVTGHWPMFSRPADLADLLAALATGRR